MPTLSSSIVKHQVASMRDVEEALARQVLYGGDLATNLLELPSVSEAALTQVLAHAAGLEPAPTGELPRASEAVRRLVSSDVALRHGIYPLEEANGKLLVAVGEPLPAEVQEDLAFALGLDIVQKAAPHVRIRQAISRDYGVTLDRRTSRLIAKLEGKPDPSPSSMPPEARPAPEMPGLPRPPTVPPMAYPGMERQRPAEDPTRNTKPKPETARNEVHAQAVMGLVQAEAQRQRRRRVGPYTAAMAEKDVVAAESRDDLLRAFFDFAAQYFEYAALFVVHGDLAEGRDAHGPGADAARLNGIGVPLDLPSSLSDVRREQTFRLTRLAADGLDASFANDLERTPGKVVLLLPVVVRNRCVLILYGDHGSADVELASVGEVIAFAGLVATALERIIVRKKAGAGAASALARPAAPKRPKHVPNFDQRAAALAGALNLSSTSADTADTAEPPAAHTSAPPSVSDAAPESMSDAAPEPAPEQDAPPRIPQGRPPVPEAAQLPSRTERGRDEGRAQDGNRAAPFVELSRPVITIGLASVNGQSASGEAHDASDSENAYAPSSRKMAHSAQPLRPRQSPKETRLPTVIVDLESDCRELVRRLVAGDLEASDKLFEIGEPAITALISVFPGPITGEPRRSVGEGPARASDYGPVLRTLARLGSRATPFVIVRTNDIDPKVRSFATRLLGELPNVEGALAVVRRLSDSDVEVRRAALAAARMLQNHSEARQAIRDELLEVASSPSRPTETRHVAVEALADLREPRSVPRLIRLLTDGATEIAKSAHWALVVIARQDFGRDVERWKDWWESNSGKSRIEWLIDSLMHDVADIRRAAGDELKSLTKEYFGYYDDLPKKERARAQQRYREWWDSQGKARFP